MRIDVTDILAQNEGYRTSFEVVNEPVELEDYPVEGGASGELTLVRTLEGIELDGRMQLTLSLECHRCLRPYSFPEKLRLRGRFSRLQGQAPIEDSWLIAKDFHIDLDPLICQEAILSLPIKQLCTPDCLGLDPQTGKLKVES